MLHSLETLARDAKSWPFEQARNLLAHVLKKRLSDAERNAAKLLIDAGKADEALATFEALQKPVLLKNQAQFATQKRQRGPIKFAHVLTTDQQDTTGGALDTGHQFE